MRRCSRRIDVTLRTRLTATSRPAAFNTFGSSDAATIRAGIESAVLHPDIRHGPAVLPAPINSAAIQVSTDRGLLISRLRDLQRRPKERPDLVQGRGGMRPGRGWRPDRLHFDCHISAAAARSLARRPRRRRIASACRATSARNPSAALTQKPVVLLQIPSGPQKHRPVSPVVIIRMPDVGLGEFASARFLPVDTPGCFSHWRIL